MAVRVGIEARPLCWPTEGGIQRVCTRLIPALAAVMPEAELEVITAGEIPAARDPGLPVQRLRGSKGQFLARELPRCVRRRCYDVVLALSPQMLPMPAPIVQVVYDCYPLRYFNLLPRHLLADPRYWMQFGGALARMAVIGHLASVVAISADTALQVRARSRRSDLRVSVAYPGVALPPAEPDGGAVRCEVRGLTDRPYVLYVGALNVHKNIGALIGAVGALRKSGGIGYDLVLAGHQNWPRVPGLLDTCRERGVHVVEECSDSELAFLYRNCLAFVCLSRYEGFGLPVLEAMAHGAPVVVSDRGALPEVVGAAGIVVDPDCPREVLGALELVCDREENERRRELSVAQAARFSWEAMAGVIAGELIAVREWRRERKEWSGG